MTDTHAGGAKLAPEFCAQLLADKLSQFRAAQLVVTDRLHGMILSVLAGTPCIVLPNSNHKIKQTWLDWLQDQPLLAFLEVDQLNDLPVLLEQLLSSDRSDVHSPGLTESLYSKLSDALAMQDANCAANWRKQLL